MGKITTSAEIGRKLKEFRGEAGLSQEKLAEKLGMSFQQMQKYESGRSKMNTDKLQHIAEALSVPISAFFDNQPVETTPLSGEEKKLIGQFRKIKNQKAKESIMILIDVAATTIA